MGPVGHQRGKQVVDNVGSYPVDPFPHGVGGHVRPGGRQSGGAGEGPGNFLGLQRVAVGKAEQDGVAEPGRLTGEKVIKEGLV